MEPPKNHKCKPHHTGPGEVVCSICGKPCSFAPHNKVEKVMSEIEIKSKAYHLFQTEVERLGQKEACQILRLPQSCISRAINHPETVTISWFVKCMKKFGYKVTFTITKEE